MQLLHPRHWPTRLGLLFLFLISYLPFPAKLRFGSLLGTLGYHLAASRRQIARINLALCFPDLSEQQLDSLLRKVFRSTGMSIVETATSWFQNPQDYAHRYEIIGAEILQSAMDSDRGTLLLGMHFSTLDISGAVVGTFAKVDVMYRRSKNPLFDSIMRNGRHKHFDEVIERDDLRGVIKRLKKGHTVWYGGDQDYGPKHSVFVPFFGIQTATITATSRIARMTGADVILYRHFRISDDGHYRIIFSKPEEAFPTDDDQRDALQINHWVEDAIAQYPEQYWWLHKRFKTRPPGEPGFYR